MMGLKVEAHKRASLERYELFTFILHHLLNAAFGEAGRQDVQTIMNFFAHGAKKCHADELVVFYCLAKRLLIAAIAYAVHL